MFESAIQTALLSDTQLASLLSTYGSGAAVFSENAPEDAEMPYVTYRIERDSTDAISIQAFSLFVDYWEYDNNRVNARKASERIEFALDNKTFDTDRYRKIRVWLFNAAPVPETDPRAIHYNHLFTCRATRKAWADQIISS